MDTYWTLGREASVAAAKPVSAEMAGAGPASAERAPLSFALPPIVPTITGFTPGEISTIDWNRWMPGIVAGWLMGVVLLTGRKAGGLVVLRRLRRRGVSAPGDVMSELFRQACGKIGVDSRRVCLKISSLVQVPMTMGWVRPVVLFPAALLSGLSTGEIEFLLAHELAHIRRCDYLVNLLQTVVETLFFYHPVAWWISRRMRQERENCCDDLVAARSAEALAYAKVLVRLETMRPSGASLASAANGGSLLQRVQRLIGEPEPRSGMGLPLLFALVSILGVIAAVPVVEAQAPTPGKSADIPVAVPVSPTPEPAFAQPVTMKETKSGDAITRLYYQGGNLVLQQELNVSPGSVGQLVFYKHEIVVVDNRGTQPISISSRTIHTNDDKITVQSIAADSVSPARLRLLDPEQEIITEFFIDKTGLMRPITKAEHDADIARRYAAFGITPPASNSATPMTAEEAKQQGIAAMVNQHPIQEVAVEQQTAYAEKTLKEHLSGNELTQKVADARQNALQALIDRKLIIENFKSQGEFIPKSYTDDRIDDIVKDQYGGDRNAFLKTLAERHITLEMYGEEIEDNAIVGYMRNKNVVEKVWQYYQDHLDLFPQDEQINITLIAIPCDENKPPSDHNQNPKYLAAQQALDQVMKGADFAVLAKTLANKYHYHRFFSSEPNQWNTTQWLTENGEGSVHIPALWQAIEKLQPGRTSGIIEGDWFYGIARLNERRPARTAATEETTKQKQALIDAEAKRLSEEWLAPLRAKARIQTFE